MTHASSRVSALRSVALTVPDLLQAEKFYTEVWHLEVAARTPDAIYLRGTGADSFILRVAVASLWQLENVLDKFMRYGTVTASVVLSSMMNKRVVTDGIESRLGFEHGAGI